MSNDIQMLDDQGYRKFGLMTGAIICGLFGLLIPWLFSLDYVKWPWILGSILILWAMLVPATLKPVYVGWMKFGTVMNWINTRIILAIIFYGLFLPTGIIMRLFNKDPMCRRLDNRQISYRVMSESNDKSNVERPY